MNAAPLDKRGQYISARKRDMFAALATDLGLAERHGDAPERLYQLLTAILHYEYLGELELLHDAYYDLDPARRDGTKSAPTDAAFVTLTEAIERVLKGANFIEVEPEQLERASKESGRIRQPVRTGVADFRAIRLFRRGQHTEEIERRTWGGLRRHKVTIEVYDEVVLFAAVRPDLVPNPRRRGRKKRPTRPGSVMIKCFRDIASADLEALYPDVQVIMTTRDKLMVGVPALVAGIPLLIKLAPAFFVVYGLLRFYLGEAPPGGDSVAEALIVASGVLALGGFLTNQWIKYERKSLRYQKEVNDTIYFNNITNNVGLFDRIIGIAEEQECKEALLAYFFLLAARDPLTQDELDRTIESWLDRRFGLSIDFEVDDALDKLDRFGILIRTGDTLSVLPLTTALTQLDRRWDNFFQFAEVA